MILLRLEPSPCLRRRVFTGFSHCRQISTTKERRVLRLCLYDLRTSDAISTSSRLPWRRAEMSSIIAVKLHILTDKLLRHLWRNRREREKKKCVILTGFKISTVLEQIYHVPCKSVSRRQMMILSFATFSSVFALFHSIIRRANLNNVFYRPTLPCYSPGRQEGTCAYLS